VLGWFAAPTGVAVDRTHSNKAMAERYFFARPHLFDKNAYQTSTQTPVKVWEGGVQVD